MTTRFVGTYDETGRDAFVRVDGDAFLEPAADRRPGRPPRRAGGEGRRRRADVPQPRPIGRGGGDRGPRPPRRRGRGRTRRDPRVRPAGGVPRRGARRRQRGGQAVRARTDLGDRLDLTKETVVTIDPATARDFDDAISLKRIKNGHWVLGVHIADVAHFVKPGSALDKEAKDRATSVYLPGKVIPMLPEVISNGLASLQQGKVRYVKTCFVEFDPERHPGQDAVRQRGDQGDQAVRLRAGDADHRRSGRLRPQGAQDGAASVARHVLPRHDAPQTAVRRRGVGDAHAGGHARPRTRKAR